MQKTLIFVDGENLWLQYQEMVNAGRTPHADNVVAGGCFVWNQRVLDGNMWNLKRLSYYTSMVGANEEIWAIRQQIAAVKFTVKSGVVPAGLGSAHTTYTGQIVPFVRKKARRSNKESICDIAIAVDVMRACYRDHADTIWIMSGDGDFRTLFEEVIHSGKTAYCSALSSGLNPELPLVVDEFIGLDDHFFEPLVAPQPSDPTGQPAPPLAA